MSKETSSPTVESINNNAGMEFTCMVVEFDEKELQDIASCRLGDKFRDCKNYKDCKDCRDCVAHLVHTAENINQVKNRLSTSRGRKRRSKSC